MNMQSPKTFPQWGALKDRQFVLATDLDGTFLGGSDEDRRKLYDWIEANRETVGLIFVTGRDPEFIGELCSSNGVPWPEYAVGDVGTTIATVSPSDGVSPILHLEEEIAARWGEAGESVRARLDGHPGLRLQPTDFRYRVSYDLDHEAFDRSACSIVPHSTESVMSRSSGSRISSTRSQSTTPSPHTGRSQVVRHAPESTSELSSPSSHSSPVSITSSPQRAPLQSVRHASERVSEFAGPSSQSSPESTTPDRKSVV